MTYSVRTLDNPFESYEQIQLVKEFCREAEKETDNASINNVRFEDWMNNPASLLYVISSGRFEPPDGTFQVVEFEGKPVAVAGAYKAEFDSGVRLVGCRTWTLAGPHRAKFLIGDYILPIQLEWATETGGDIAMFTFAQYNRWLAKMILRASSGRALGLGQSNSPAYSGWVAHPTLCRIKGVEQIVLYKQLSVTDRIPDLRDIDTEIPSQLG